MITFNVNMDTISIIAMLTAAIVSVVAVYLLTRRSSKKSGRLLSRNLAH